MKCKLITATALLALLTFGCNEPDDGSYTAPISIYEKIDGQWNLASVKMVDEVAKANGVEPNEQNLSGFFNYEDFKIRFDVDAAGQPTSYEVLGDVPTLFPANGYYQLSSPFQQPSGSAVRIHLFSDAQKTQKTDELRLTAVPGSAQEMELQLVRTSSGTPFVSYVFRLTASN
ncbi:DUF5004 domain-containing protein [Flavobacterium caeni]|uniref:DUF5004 domain-containing protein n=1 Tax=Flavobacterium caeni TaxID=490189 RepID=A0A1G5E2D9_9FLAO|nr:DUF5004 domain-containing protein [Flavobacterium caeni]SCY20920.1 protein of unknown function [Flavobacterium caeni]